MRIIGHALGVSGKVSSAALLLLLGCSAGDGLTSEQTGTAPSELTAHGAKRFPSTLKHQAPRHLGHGRWRPPGRPPASDGVGGVNGSSAGSPSMGGAPAGGSPGPTGGWSGSLGFSGAIGSGATGAISSVCGNGIRETGETCDDGNAVSSDGCDANCQLESGWGCLEAGVPCQPVICGDWVKDWYFVAAPQGTSGSGGMSGVGYYASEECDDGNTQSGDGCSPTCALEKGWSCNDPAGACHQIRCGDGFEDWVPGTAPIGGSSGIGGVSGAGGSVDYGHFEQCDDGNAVSGDGCSESCVVETGWICPEPGVGCHQPTCGDGLQDYWTGAGGSGNPGASGATSVGGTSGIGGVAGAGGSAANYQFEACDDGNANSGDGCNASCQLESGWVCDEPGRPCRQPACGDGMVDYSYGGVAGGGGAGNTGNVPNSSGAPGRGGASSAGSPGTAGSAPVSAETCDDGNQTPGDGCDPTCVTEPGWACDWTGPCHPIVCGDGVWDYPNEQCDDGNNVRGDGCDNCRSEYSAGGTSGVGGSQSTAGAPAASAGRSP